MEIKEIVCYLSLGSNLGNRKKNLTDTIAELQKFSSSIIETSNFIESEPWGFKSTNVFINCCVKITTDLEPAALLKNLKEIEITMGRQEKSIESSYEDRMIDIDIIFYGSEIIQTETLTIPHPLYQKRNFVLLPLLDLNPNLIDPVTKISVLQYHRNIQSN